MQLLRGHGLIIPHAGVHLHDSDVEFARRVAPRPLVVDDVRVSP